MSSKYEVQELVKNDCHILLYYDDEQIGHISYVFHEEMNKRFLSSSLYHLMFVIEICLLMGNN